MASVSYDNVTKRFAGGIVAVKNLSLEIKDTEFMVLVGPSGCGKSTALRMLAGLEEITEGEIRIGDQVVNEMPPRDRDIAMVFQSYALYPHMTVYDNMAFGLKMRGIQKSEIERRVNNAANILELSELLARKPRNLSGGQRQRVALGRAIVREPQAFLLDEPLSNLDAKLRVQTRIELQKQHQLLHATFIYVTHDQVEAMTMGDRIVVMKDGIIQQVAEPIDLYDHPKNMFEIGRAHV
jgi:multiple sugar transport system ATP-binding protein